jgi:hypothetical protein
LIDSVLYDRPMQTIDPRDPAELEHRAILHKIRLGRILCECEFERTCQNRDVKCLFCDETFSGTWHDYLQWLFERHRFNPGRPFNLVFIPELVELLRETFKSKSCVYCGEMFQTQKQLQTHLKKKGHMRIPDRRMFDRYYLVNYLEPGQTWRDVVADGDGEEDDGDLEEKLRDFEDDCVVEETECLICDLICSNPVDCILLMETILGFGLGGGSLEGIFMRE